MLETVRIALREMRERRVVLAAALVAGLLALASPLFPGVRAEGAAEARDVAATVIAVMFGLVLSLMLGATAIGRDLSEHRLSFDFTRPVRGASIWAGRLGAAVALSVAAMLAVMTPALLAGGRPTLPDWVDAPWVHLGIAALTIALAGVGLAHVAGVAFRSHSRWLAVDLVGLVVVLLIVVTSIRRLLAAFAPQTAFVATVSILVAAGVTLWIASAAQVISGRTDVLRGHRIQSIVLWSLLSILSLGLAGYSRWYVSAELSELNIAGVRPAPDGSWIAVVGSAPGRDEVSHQFLVDTERSRSIHVGIAPNNYLHQLRFSADGRRAVSVGLAAATDSTFSLSTVDLTEPTPAMRATSLGFALEPFFSVLSPSGRRLATLQDHRLLVHELDTGRLLAVTRLDLPGRLGWSTRLAFRGEDRVRAYVLKERLQAHDLDVATGSLASWVGPEIDDDRAGLVWRDDHQRLILTGHRPLGSVLVDGSSRETIAQLVDVRARKLSGPAFLADGRIVLIVESARGHAVLELLSTEGVALRSFDLGPSDSDVPFLLGPEVAPGTISIERAPELAPGTLSIEGSRALSLKPRTKELLLLDLETGRIREVPGGGHTVAGFWWFALHGPSPRPGSVASRLIHRDDSVWLLDPETATVRLLFGPGDASGGLGHSVTTLPKAAPRRDASLVSVLGDEHAREEAIDQPGDQSVGPDEELGLER